MFKLSIIYKIRKQILKRTELFLSALRKVPLYLLLLEIEKKYSRQAIMFQEETKHISLVMGIVFNYKWEWNS